MKLLWALLFLALTAPAFAASTPDADKICALYVTVTTPDGSELEIVTVPVSLKLANTLDLPISPAMNVQKVEGDLTLHKNGSAMFKNIDVTDKIKTACGVI